MIKKAKEYRSKENQILRDKEIKQQKVFENLTKLAKRRKLVSNQANSKSTLSIENQNLTERSDLGITLVSKNLSVLKSVSKNQLHSSKLIKTQKKPKMKKITQKWESPNKMLSSDSELEDLSPERYAEYWNIISQFNSEKADKWRAMPLQRQHKNQEQHLMTPPKIDKIQWDGLNEINEGTQNGWLASQHKTDKNSDISPSHDTERRSKSSISNKEEFELPKEINQSNLGKESEVTNPTPFAFKREYEYLQRQSVDDTINEKILDKPVKMESRPSASHRPFYKSIIAITAAVVVQNYWREYIKRKKGKKNLINCGKEALESIKNNIQASLIESKNPKTESFNFLTAYNDPKQKDEEAKVVKQPSNNSQNAKNKFLYDQESDAEVNENKKLKRISPKDYLVPDQKDSIEADKAGPKIRSIKEQISQKEHIGYEVWKEKDQHKQSPKHKPVGILENPIEIIKDMKKNKDKITDILSKSKSKRHSIWSEHGDSENSFDSNGWLKNRQNSSFNFFNHNKLGVPSTDHSINSIILSNDKNRSDKSNKNIFLIDHKPQASIIKPKEQDLQKEIEYEPIKLKDSKGKPPMVEIVKPNLHEKSKSVSTKTQEVDLTEKNKDSHSFVHEKSSNNERSLVDYLNEKFEKEIGNKSNERSKVNRDFLNPEDNNNKNDLKEPSKSQSNSFSPEIPREAIEKETSDLDQSENTRHISLKNFDPEPNQKSGLDDQNVQTNWLENYL